MNTLLLTLLGLVVALGAAYIAILIQYRKGERFSLPFPWLILLFAIHLFFSSQVGRIVALSLDACVLFGAVVIRVIENKRRKNE